MQHDPTNQSSDTVGQDAADAHQKSEQENLFATATILARKGRYEQAVDVLERARDAEECSAAEAHDLLARIYAQQGRYLDAEECWGEAKREDPSNPAYDDGLAALRRIQRGSARVLPLAVGTPAVVLVLFALWQMFVANPAIDDQQGMIRSALSDVQDDLAFWEQESQERQDRRAAEIATLQESLNVRLVALNEAIQRAAGDTRQRAEALQSTLTEQREDLRTLHGSLVEQQEDLAEMEARLQKKINDLDSAMERLTTSAELEGVQRNVQTLQQEFTEWSNQQQQHSTAQSKEIEALRGSIAEITEGLSAAEGRLDGRIVSLEKALQALPASDRVEELHTDLHALQGEVTTLGKDLQKLSADQSEQSQTLQASVTGVSERLKSVEGRLIERIERTEAELRQGLASTAADVTGVGRSILMIQQQLARPAQTRNDAQNGELNSPESRPSEPVGTPEPK